MTPREYSPQLDVRDLRLVAAVAAEGSLTLAGVRLNLTQPALSRHLSKLERRLGATLFARTGPAMRPTTTGERLLRHAREVLDRIAAAETDLRELRGTPSRQLRIGVDCYTGYHWLPQVLNRYTARHPDVDVAIAFEAAGDPVARLRVGSIEVALVTDAGPRKGFSVTRLFSDEYIAVVAPDHRLAGRTSIEPSDIVTDRLLLMAPAESSLVVRQWIGPARVSPKFIVDVQLIGAVAALAEASFGVGLVPSWTIAPEVRSGRLIPLRLGRNGFKRNWSAVCDRSASRERWLREFVEALATDGPAFGVQPPSAGRLV